MSETEARRRIAAAVVQRAERLSLTGLGLKSPPRLPQDLSSLRELDLSGNRLSALDLDPASLCDLSKLDLGENRFLAVPPEILHLPRLRSLDLSLNRLAALGKLPELTELSLFGNRLAEVPSSLLEVTSLRRLDLANNRLAALPAFDAGKSHLEWLDLSGNVFARVPAELGRLNSLRSLNLAGNWIESADGIERLASLEELDLSSNRLTAAPLAALGLKHLALLDLYANPIGALPEVLRALAGEEHQRRAMEAVAATVSGGMQEGKNYFEPVSFVIGCVVALGGFAAVASAVERYYKRFDGVAAVVLEFPSGSKVSLANVTYKRALEIAREHEAELSTSDARLQFANTSQGHRVERAKEYAVEVLTRVNGSSLIAPGDGRAAQHFTILNPVFNVKEVNVGDNITISNVSNSILNVKSKLDGVTQSLADATIEPAKKDELKTLIEQLNVALQKVPAEKHEDVEAVADSLKETMDKVKQEKPNKKSIFNSLSGLLSAAKDVAEALPVATRIAAVVAGMFGIVL